MIETEAQRALCANCGHAIIWHFDVNDDGEPEPPHGFWYDAEGMTEACGGPDGDPDEDLWHEPQTGTVSTVSDLVTLAHNDAFLRQLTQRVNDQAGIYLAAVDVRDILRLAALEVAGDSEWIQTPTT